MLAFYKMRFFILVFSDEYFTAIQRIADNIPEQAFTTFKALLFGFIKDLLGIIHPIGNLLVSPSYYAGFRFFRDNVLSFIFICLVVYLVSLATFVIFFQGFMVAPILPGLSAEFKTSIRYVSFIEPSYLLGYGLFTLVYTPLSERLGRFKIILVCLILFSIFTLLTAFVGNINQMIVLRLITGISASGVAPTTISWISDNYPYEKRGMHLGYFLAA